MSDLIKAIIVDDEPLAHKVILEYVKDISYLEVQAQFHLATEALIFLNQNNVDLIFLDINMPKIKGLEMLRLVTPRPQVIITSAYEEYALESFELNVCDYLLKPFRFDRFLMATNRVRDTLMGSQPPQSDLPPASMQHPRAKDHIFVKSDKKMIKINYGEIYYLESYGNYVKVWLEGLYHLTPRSLTSFDDQLPAGTFFRIHKSYIINRNYIDFIEGNMLLLKNGTQLPIGKNQRTAFRKYLED